MNWVLNEREYPLIKSINESTGLHPLLIHLLINRGIKTPEQALAFLNPSLSDIETLSSVPGCAHAAEVIAACEGQKILVFGDYDADGVTATALVVDALTKQGFDVSYHIPDRFSEGYDLNCGFIDRAHQEGIGLIITVDCGVRAVDSIEKAGMLGIKTVITDHHEPGNVVPAADAVVNPKLNSCENVKGLAGVGVAFGLVIAFEKLCNPAADAVTSRRCELAALGTIADAVQLTGINRSIVKIGLGLIPRTENPGLAALLEIVGLSKKETITETDAAYRLVPSINAAGRIGHASDAVKLLMTGAAQEAWELAKKLHDKNSMRQLLENQVIADAAAMVEREVDLESEKVIVLGAEGWHPGVIGIAASRIADTYNRPTLLVSLEEGVGRGSGRSRNGFDLIQAFNSCADLFIRFGGHVSAGGFDISAENFTQLRTRMNDHAQKHGEYTGEETLRVDVEVLPDELDRDFIKQLDVLRPFGPGNQKPLFLLRNALVKSSRLVGKNKEHLKLDIEGRGADIQCIGFGLHAQQHAAGCGNRVDVFFFPEMNTWNDTERIQLNLCMLRQSIPDEIEEESAGPCGRGSEKAAAVGNSGGEILQIARRHRRVLFFGSEADGLSVHTAEDSQFFDAIVYLFPLRSLAVEFQRRLAEKSLSAHLLDGSSSPVEIGQCCSELLSGSARAVVSTFEFWQGVEELRETADRIQALLHIVLGNWDGSHFLENMTHEVSEIVGHWPRNAIVSGYCGKPVEDLLTSELEIDHIVRKGTFSPSPLEILFDAADKEQIIKEMLGTGVQKFVICGGLDNAAYVQEALASAGVSPYEIKRLRPGLTASQRKLVLEGFERGTTRVLILEGRLDTEVLACAEVVLCTSIPSNPFYLNRLLMAEKVYVAYNEGDLEEALNRISGLCPDRVLLNTVYKIKKGVPGITADGVYSRLRSLCSGSLSKTLVHSANYIIEDLRLTDVDSGGFRNKIDPKTSWRYRDSHREIRAFRTVVERLGLTACLEAAAAKHEL